LPNVSSFPEWAHALRLFIAFLLTAGFGIHAFYQHKQEAIEAVSPRKWMYWIYSVVFLGASSINFMQLCVTMVFRNYQKASFHLGYFTLLLMLSYAALLAGVRKRGFE
jgi:cell division protein FtsW (lipid II flippase)